MIDHVTLRVSDFHASKAFYETVLASLGYVAPWSEEEKGYYAALILAHDGINVEAVFHDR